MLHPTTATEEEVEAGGGSSNNNDDDGSRVDEDQTESDPNEYDAGTDEREEVSDSCGDDGYEDRRNGPFDS